ncbi:hypothetical protein GCM10023321_47400 [Pseudonocardia eucalypti]|uniref:CBS domain-containing protein n=1 Tax=Pseudonocardia eucalypti TaxID=648755 RepID=A0ABP9QI06_9PSEU|nr:CBS domain-containing protein [Pseudonocardia eucalypti]
MALGVISERDRVFGTGAELDEQPAEDVMNPDVAWVSAKDTIRDVAARMDEAGVRHLPVRDQRGTVVGRVSARDLLSVLADPATTETE